MLLSAEFEWKQLFVFLNVQSIEKIALRVPIPCDALSVYTSDVTGKHMK